MSFPSIWKTARITAIPKEQGTSDPSKFRPISIVPIFSKLAESWLLQCLKPYLKTSCFQFAFKCGSSVEDAIVMLQSQVANGFNSCHPLPTRVALISIDIAKAFDQVSHRLLLNCLHSREVPGSRLLGLLRSYLSGRSQVITVEGHSSQRVDDPSGVPQGEVIAPSLFNVFIDSIVSTGLPPTAHPMVRIQFADDLLCIKTLRDVNDERELQIELDAVSTIISNLGLSVNVDKSALLLCSLAPRRPALLVQPSLNGSPIPRVSQLKYLGIILDRRLAFDANTQISATTAKKIVGVLWAQAGKYIDAAAFHSLCTAKVLPVLTYCLAATLPRAAKDFASLEKVLRFVLRLITNNFTAPYEHLLQLTGEKSLAQRWFIACLTLVYKYVHSLRNFPIQLKVSALRHSQRNQPHHCLQIHFPYFRQKSCDSLPIFRAFTLWNNFPSGSWGNSAEILESTPALFKRTVADSNLYSVMSGVFAFLST